MNYAEIHLAINHMPLAGSLFGVFTLGVAILVKNRGALKVGLIFLIAAAVLCIPTVESGEEAEEIIENLGMDEEVHHYIHEHEEMAESARWLSIVIGLLASASLYFTIAMKAPAKIFSILTLAGGIASTVYLVQVAHSGGEIRHEEVRPGFVIPTDPHDHAMGIE